MRVDSVQIVGLLNEGVTSYLTSGKKPVARQMSYDQQLVEIITTTFATATANATATVTVTATPTVSATIIGKIAINILLF